MVGVVNLEIGGVVQKGLCFALQVLAISIEQLLSHETAEALQG